MASPKTNVNEVTDLFDKHLENKEELFKKMGNSAPSGQDRDKIISEVFNAPENALESDRLQNIHPIDLNSKGQEARRSEANSFYDEYELAPDLTKPGNSKHKADADSIANRTSNVVGDVLSKLREEGMVDCQEEQGNIQQEAVFTIANKKNDKTNTKYKQYFCEQLKNTYSCANKLKAKCKRKGMNWHTQERRHIDLSGHYVFDNRLHWLRSSKVAKKRYYHYFNQDYGTKMQVKNYIASLLGISPENIADDVQVGNHIGAGRHPAHKTGKAWIYQIYPTQYTYREGDKICLEWEKEWEEKCSIR